jgi:hypothetical protein
VLVFENPAASTAGMGAYGSQGVVGFQAIVSNAVRLAAAGGTGLPAGTAVFQRIERPNIALPLAGNRDGAFYLEPSITDRSLFDYRSYNLVGPNSYTDTDFEHFGAALEQRFLRNEIGLEMAVNRERLDSDYYSVIQSARNYVLIADVNTHLLDGTPELRSPLHHRPARPLPPAHAARRRTHHRLLGS